MYRFGFVIRHLPALNAPILGAHEIKAKPLGSFGSFAKIGRITAPHDEATYIAIVPVSALAISDGPSIELSSAPAYNTAAFSFLQPDFQKETRSMIAYVTVGADDIGRAERFYSAFLPALGYELEVGPAGLSYVLPAKAGQSPVMPDFYVKPPFDGHPASVGNGSMVAFEARNQSQVRELHAAALIAGGFDEGQPGFRSSYGPHFYVGYLRDPQGNKIAVFSSDPNERGRDD